MKAPVVELEILVIPGNPASMLVNLKPNEIYTKQVHVLQSILRTWTNQYGLFRGTVESQRNPAGCGGDTQLRFPAPYPHLLAVNPMLLINSDKQARTDRIYL